MKKIFYYTIYVPSTEVNYMTFPITFSETNSPKDKWDHHEAVTDYLIDTNPNPFEPIPHFTILRATTEQ